MPTRSTAHKPRYDPTIFAGRKKREVEFIGAKKMHHVKAGRKAMKMVTTILLYLGTPSLNVVISGTSIWVVWIHFLFKNLQNVLTIHRPSCDIAFISSSRGVTLSYPDRSGLSANLTSFLDPARACMPSASRFSGANFEQDVGLRCWVEIFKWTAF